jgi:hypothetical protein
MRFLGATVSDCTFEWEPMEGTEDGSPSVQVVTPETLAYLLRCDASHVLERFGLFIFDEVHNIADGARGWVLEGVLAFLHWATFNDGHRLVLMSAAVGNRGQLVAWLNEGRGVDWPIEYHMDWRGPRRLSAICATEPRWDVCHEEPRRSAAFPVRRVYPLDLKVTVRLRESGIERSRRLVEPVGFLACRCDQEGHRKKEGSLSTPFYECLVPLVNLLAESGPVLVIEATRPMTVAMAKAVAAGRSEDSGAGIQSLLEVVEYRLGLGHPLYSLLQKGVAYHHGSLPDDIRAMIESAVLAGDLKILVATTTLTEGVNLPVRSVVVGAVGGYGAGGFDEYIRGPRMVNALGRAGRATKETQGLVVLAWDGRVTDEVFRKLEVDPDAMQVLSRLATEESLDALDDLLQRLQDSTDVLVSLPPGILGDFLSFVWFICAKQERSGGTAGMAGVKEVLGKTLGWTQMQATARDKWTRFGGAVVRQYLATASAPRTRWATSQTTIATSKRLESMARLLATAAAAIEPPADLLATIEFVLAEGRLETLLAFPEAPARILRVHRGAGATIAPPIRVMLSDWLRGAELAELAERHLSGVTDPEFRFEQLGDYVSDYFENYLPWVVGTLVDWCNDLLAEDGVTVRLPRQMSEAIRWGTSDVASAYLLSHGIRSRRLAEVVAARWRLEEDAEDIRQWLAGRTFVELREMFHPQRAEFVSLLEFLRPAVSRTCRDFVQEGQCRVSVVTSVADTGWEAATLVERDHDTYWDYWVAVGERDVASVAPSEHADVRTILSLGLPLDIAFAATGGVGLLRLSLAAF